MVENTTLKVFEVAERDMLALFTEELSIKPEKESILMRLKPVNQDQQQSFKVTYGAYLEDSDFAKVGRIIGKPDVVLDQRIGGGSTGLDQVWLYNSRKEGKAVVSVSKTTEGNYVLGLYNQFDSYIDWWVNRYGGDCETTVANYMPPKIRFEAFLFLLHSIDMFRRITFENMLAYRFSEDLTLTYTDFAKKMSEAIGSHDIRWLLPAFLALTPGALEEDIKLEAKHASLLMDLNFLENAGQRDDGDVIMTFGEAGRVTGVEFYRTWLLGSGLEIKVAGNDGFETKGRFFIAPTALCNHFVRIEKETDGQLYANHQAYTKEQLIYQLKAQVGTVFESDNQEVEKFCSHCNNQVPVDALFCNKCGNKLN
ncbi:conserved protein of unknown function [Petrocella atlantisensis]|uniref:Zinc-ribbon domain-containing protein n=1 Tax=Petrocella atlantisensis TaxID=2173034 RepID=A0A3P7NYX7_9FIRM|nr:zinc ribbon domain-containing protein [Petrocella atlantisensis]VDN48444.1 conserved protein of unknown function [Petrocella atlantisensis]